MQDKSCVQGGKYVVQQRTFDGKLESWNISATKPSSPCQLNLSCCHWNMVLPHAIATYPRWFTRSNASSSWIARPWSHRNAAFLCQAWRKSYWKHTPETVPRNWDKHRTRIGRFPAKAVWFAKLVAESSGAFPPPTWHRPCKMSTSSWRSHNTRHDTSKLNPPVMGFAGNAEVPHLEWFSCDKSIQILHPIHMLCVKTPYAWWTAKVVTGGGQSQKYFNAFHRHSIPRSLSFVF